MCPTDSVSPVRAKEACVCALWLARTLRVFDPVPPGYGHCNSISCADQTAARSERGGGRAAIKFLVRIYAHERRHSRNNLQNGQTKVSELCSWG